MTYPAVPRLVAAAAQAEPLGAAGPDTLQPGDPVVEYVKSTLWPLFKAERERLQIIDLWFKGDQAYPNAPKTATSELKNLLSLSRTPWLGLVVTTIAQTLFVDGYRSPEARDNVPGPWTTWCANGFDARQVAIHRAAVAYGYAYVTVLPGKAPGGAPRSVLRGVSPQRMIAMWEDPASDEFPMYAMQVDPQRGGKTTIKVFDDTYIHTLTLRNDKFTYDEEKLKLHGAGLCPVVRYTNQLDLDGRTPGEVEQFIPVASRIDKTQFDRLMVQHFNSWKVRYIAGMANFAESEEEANAKKFKLRQNDILVSEDHDTKFGTLDETSLDGFIASADADIESLAAVTQLPSHLLTGKLINVNAEALSASRASMTQKGYERRIGLGGDHAKMLRLSAKLEGDDEAASDVMSRVTWQDVEVRSMAQAVDALGKAATMLGIPKRFLWSRIPGVTALDVQEWADHALDDDALSNYLRTLDQPASQPKTPEVSDVGAVGLL